MSAAVAVRGLAVDLGGARVVGPLDLDVAAGEHVLLVGRSGSGKTTLLRAIAGLVAPSAGTVELDGAAASAPGRVLVRPERRGVGMLFQGGALWPHLSVARTLRFALHHSGCPREQVSARTAELLRLVQLEGFDARLPGTLSGGEAQRLALARALSSSPRVLLLDEPLGPLDAELRGELLAMLRALQDRLGFAALHVTHDPREARSIADRALRLADGALADLHLSTLDASTPAAQEDPS